jgi:hypothetical protein
VAGRPLSKPASASRNAPVQELAIREPLDHVQILKGNAPF